MDDAEHAPRFNPMDHGLFRPMVSGDVINTGTWNRARAERKFVGTCRLCGGHLAPLPSEPSGSNIEWCEAQCILCYKAIASPWGRTLRRSSRHTEMPVGWWEHRTQTLGGAH